MLKLKPEQSLCLEHWHWANEIPYGHARAFQTLNALLIRPPTTLEGPPFIKRFQMVRNHVFFMSVLAWKWAGTQFQGILLRLWARYHAAIPDQEQSSLHRQESWMRPIWIWPLSWRHCKCTFANCGPQNSNWTLPFLWHDTHLNIKRFRYRDICGWLDTLASNINFILHRHLEFFMSFQFRVIMSDCWTNDLVSNDVQLEVFGQKQDIWTVSLTKSPAKESLRIEQLFCAGMDWRFSCSKL